MSRPFCFWITKGAHSISNKERKKQRGGVAKGLYRSCHKISSAPGMYPSGGYPPPDNFPITSQIGVLILCIKKLEEAVCTAFEVTAEQLYSLCKNEEIVEASCLHRKRGCMCSRIARMTGRTGENTIARHIIMLRERLKNL